MPAPFFIPSGCCNNISGNSEDHDGKEKDLDYCADIAGFYFDHVDGNRWFESLLRRNAVAVSRVAIRQRADTGLLQQLLIISDIDAAKIKRMRNKQDLGLE